MIIIMIVLHDNFISTKIYLLHLSVMFSIRILFVTKV